MCFNIGFAPDCVFTLQECSPGDDGSVMAASSVFCYRAFAISEKRVLGYVAMATPDGALSNCGSASRSKPPCKQSMLTAC